MSKLKLTAKQAAAMTGKPGPGKYGNKPTMVGDYRCDSRAEAARCAALLGMVASGHAQAVLFHPRFRLFGGVVYEADFLVVLHDKWGPFSAFVEDVKGAVTGRFRDVIKLWRAGADLPLVVRDTKGVVTDVMVPRRFGAENRFGPPPF